MHGQLFSWKHHCFVGLIFLMGRGLWGLDVPLLLVGEWEILMSEFVLAVFLFLHLSSLLFELYCATGGRFFDLLFVC